MAGYIKVLSLASVILFAFYTNAHQEEDEYKDLDQDNGGTSEMDLVRVTSDGKVMPFHWNPSVRDSEKPIEIIPKKKVIGGRKSSPGAVPYMVYIEFQNTLMCGGAIYNSVTILTAAHCFEGQDGMPDWALKEVNYVAGEFITGEEEGHEQRRKFVKLVVHPEFTLEKSFADIAIVTVDKPFEYNKYVQPIPVGRPAVVPEDVGVAQVSGWGYTLKRRKGDEWDRKYFPNKLQEANVRVFTKAECYGFYEHNRNVSAYIDAGLICAGQKDGVKDACQGDSGGPLACYDPTKRNRRYLCGIVAMGIGCGVPGLPGLYTRVAEFHDWIISHSGYADKRTVEDVREEINSN